MVGVGLWLCQRPRQPFASVVGHFDAIGQSVVAHLNATAQQVELARRHAKPSTRKRVA